jgi:hypothetical protein
MMMTKKKKLVGYELVQAIKASIQNKVTGKRGARATTWGITCSNVTITATASKKESVRIDSNNNRRRP